MQEFYAVQGESAFLIRENQDCGVEPTISHEVFAAVFAKSLGEPL